MAGKTPMDYLLDKVAWQQVPEPDEPDNTMPYATHSGALTIEGFGTLRVYRLSTGERVIDGTDLEAFFSALAERTEGTEGERDA